MNGEEEEEEEEEKEEEEEVVEEEEEEEVDLENFGKKLSPEAKMQVRKVVV